jgi:DNA invertase Pin-like site-specific DNA recombinase
MIAAVYARKSTEQNVAEDAKSVTRQIEHARAFAAARGWPVLEEYIDDGVSGAVATKLTGRARMLAAAQDDKFSVVIVRDVDRLSRNDEELPGIIYSLRDAGVEVWSYADQTRVDTRTAMSRGMLTMKATFAAAEREAAQARTREAMRSRAERGHVAGGKVYGYRNVRTEHVAREIVEAEAEVIRRIFREIAAGRGYARVAQGLNADAVPAPQGRRWAMTCVREMVFRPLYRGGSSTARRGGSTAAAGSSRCACPSPSGSPSRPPTCGSSRRISGAPLTSALTGRDRRICAQPAASCTAAPRPALSRGICSVAS